MPIPDCTLVGCNKQTPIVELATCAPAGIDGEITGLFFTDVEPADTTVFTSYDNTAAGGMKYLPVTGSINAPEQGSQEVEGGVTLFSKLKGRSINFSFYNLSDTNYNVIRELECGKPLLFFPVIGDEKILGGEATFLNGISSTINLALASDGAGSFLRADGSISWKAKYSPEWIDKP